MRSNDNGSLGRYLLAAAVLVVLASGVRAEDKASDAGLGRKVDSVAFHDASGKSFALHDLKDKKAIVVVFLSFDCPVSTSYSQPLAELAKRYGERGVVFLGVCPGDEVRPAELARHAEEFKIPFPVFKDEGNAAVDQFKAEFTPEAFVLDGDFVLRYRGRIDNGYAARLKRSAQTTRHDLQQALDEVLAGKPVSEAATRPVGCPIVRGPARGSGSVTYYRDVLPILQNNCQSCHRPDEAGPFSLMTYRQAANWADDVKRYTQERKMPPWKPVEGPAFHDERRLSDKEIATLAAWVEGGTPEGDPGEAPPARQFTEGWQLGQPDLVLTPEDDFQVGAEGRDVFRCFVLPTNLGEDKYVTAVEIRPGNRRVVHHALLYIDGSGQGRKLLDAAQAREKKETDKDQGAGYSSSMGIGFVPQGGLGGWAPGQRARHLPDGTGYSLPKGSDVILQLHYHRDGRAEKDCTSVGLYFATRPVARQYRSAVLPGRFLAIPAGDAHYKVTGSLPPLATDAVLYSIMPHMHMLGREIKVTALPPNGPPLTLIAINDWDYNWQETYFFKEPIALKAGTRFEVEAYYDNSAKNPSNPFNPPQIVLFGQQTTNEMCFVFLGGTAEGAGRFRFERTKPAANVKGAD